MRRHPTVLTLDSTAPCAAPPITNLVQFLQRRRHQDLLRFITCGSVDDGKSTLIGRLLWEAGQLAEDQVAMLRSDSRKYGTQGGELDFALLMDGLIAEREQAITIDVAYRYFASGQRKFIVADTPGHEQYTRNMVSGASTAEAAVLLVDARRGLMPQTRRHLHVVSLMGIRHIVLAVNKMDLVSFVATPFERIRDEFQHMAATLGHTSVAAIPLSALRGDNVTRRSPSMPWHAGPTLLGYLETVKPAAETEDRLVFPVQWVNRPNAQFRGYSGSVAEGSVRVGDQIRVTGSGRTASVAEIITFDGSLQCAELGEAVTLRLDQELDASRGDVLSLARSPLETSDHFEATLVWMSDQAGLVGRTYDLKLATQWTAASITTIKHRIDVDTLAHQACRKLELNDICVCNVATTKPLTFAAYGSSRALGGFILVDRFNRATVAAGMIRHNLRRSQNVHRQALSISRGEREQLNGHQGKVVWFTGLPSSGKSTVANALEVELHSRGMRTYILDGDNVRQGLNKDLGFTDADRTENIRRIAEVAKLMMDAGLIVMTAFISPFRHEREMARTLIGSDNFVEVYVCTPLAVCEQRDPKGLYRKARAGQLPNMTGISSAYEPPTRAEISLDMDAMSIGQGVESVLRVL